MIWVWAENGPDAALESALTPALLVPELDDREGLASGKVSPANVGQNDLAYGWDTLMVRYVFFFRTIYLWHPSSRLLLFGAHPYIRLSVVGAHMYTLRLMISDNSPNV